ncbi:uncharacterized protein BJ171DRAFT_502754 [Polychytrium aggregatum]|uniref:uncharacterized protein n=1 Tax=Polychytrium aggregatum TaxID=110093 RepID=UPI0022FE97AC|nr:uncharacterized protein BJ171DRAFT_502754 [Polychytrium aggregatum]KAI9205035.1 hypothetical protein BJ171DRAFT_502754 [Polychytrium aggregatum]
MNPPPAPASNESAAVGPVMDRLPSRPPSYVSRISSADLPRPDPESLASPPARSRFWSSLPNRLLKQLPRSCINERFVPSSNLRSGLYVLTYLYIVVSFLQLDSSVRDPQQLLQNIYSLVDCSMILLNFVALVSVLVGLSAQRKSIMTVVTIWSFIYDVYGLIAYSLTAAGQIPSTDSASATPLILLILMFAIQVCKIYFSLVIYSYTMYLHLNPQSLEDIDLELHSRSPWDPQDDEDLPVYQPRPPGYSETPHTADSIAPSRTLRRGARSTESMARRNQSTAQSTSTTHETSVPPPPADSIPPVPSTSQAGAPAPDTNTDAAGSASQTDTQSASEPARPDSQEPPARS